MNRREKSFNEKLKIVEQIAEGVQREYNSLPQDKRYGYDFTARINTQIMLTLSCSERKAIEWARLAKNKRKYFPDQQNP